MKRETFRLQRTLLLHFVAYLCVGVLFLFFVQTVILDGFANDRFAAWFVRFAQNTLGRDEEGAIRLYNYWFTDKKLLYMLLACALVGLTSFWLVTRKVIRYLGAIAGEMDKLVKGREEDIQLPGEIAFMTTRLNRINHELLAQQEAAREAEQRKNDLVVYLAHDLKTPLTSVTGYLNLLSEAPDMPTEQRARYTGIALEKANRLEQLVDEFFDITRFSLQTVLLQREHLDLRRMLEQMADELYPLLSEQHKEIALALEGDLDIEADADKLARVIDNVLKNAIAYGDPGGTISIHACRDEAQLVLTITNQGPTIPPEKLEMIFERFFRLDAARTSTSGGAGLGLAIAKEIIRAHEGTISAESAEGATTFTIILPAKAIRKT